MPEQSDITKTLDIVTRHNPMKSLPPVAHDTYAAEAFSLAALHQQNRLTPQAAATVFRFWNPYLKPPLSEFEELIQEIRAALH